MVGLLRKFSTFLRISTAVTASAAFKSVNILSYNLPKYSLRIKRA